MALDEMYSDAVQRAVINRAQRAPVAPLPQQGFSLWGTIKAPFAGAGAGAVESAAFLADTANVFGDVQASYNYAGMTPVGVDMPQEWDPDEAEAAQRRLLSGESFSSDVGDEIRRAGRSFAPNQETAGYAEQTLFQAARVITKAVGYSVAGGGVVAGAIGTGLDEAATASDELRREGVDIKTRMKVGALTGAATAAGVALPVAGTGLASTAGLVVAGGPGLFAAQTWATREILQNANYDDLAMQYDPFDPVGLAVSTLLPAAFGGWALRARAARARSEGKAADGAPESVDPASAEGLRNVAHDSDLADAARVNAVRELVDSWKLEDPGNVRAANDALLSVMRASDQLASGDRVSVLDSLPINEAQGALAIERMLARAEAARADLLPQAWNLAEPGAVSAMRREVQALAARAAGADEAALREAAKLIQRDTPQTSYKKALAQAKRQAEEQAAEARAAIERLEAQIEANAEAVDARRALAVLDEQIAEMKAARSAIDAPATEVTPVAGAVRQMIREQGASARRDAAPAAEGLQRPPRQEGLPGQTQAEPQANSPQPVPTQGSITPAAVQAASDAALAGRVAELAETRPDALVRPEGAEGDMTVREALRQLEEDAARFMADADLLRVAANCAIGAI